MSTYVPPTDGVALALVGVTLPDDGDDPDAASVGVPFETLADGIRHLQVILDPSTGRAASYEPMTRMMGTPFVGDNAVVTAAVDGDGHPRPAIQVSATFRFGYMLDLPHGSVIRGVRVYVYRPTTTSVSVWRRDYAVSTGGGGDVDELPVVTQLGSTGTTQTTVAGDTKYVEVLMTETIDREDAADYFVLVGGTANADTNFMPKVRVALDLKTIDQGAA